MKDNKAFNFIAIAGMMAFNAVRTLEGKFLAWKDKAGIHSRYDNAGQRAEGSKRGKGMKEYHRRRANMHGRDHNSFGTFSPIRPIMGARMSWELK